MDPSNDPTTPFNYSNFTISGNSRAHLGNNYNNNIYLGSVYHEPSEDERKRAIAQHLRFAGIDHRKKHIHEAPEVSYRWAFDASFKPMQAWSAENDDMLWISGKAGSGKSTFMKFLSSNSNIATILTEWTKDRPLIVAKHYFSNFGNSSSLEKSREGLYRNLLWQVLQSLPQIIPQALPERWKSYTKPLYQEADWTIKELLHGLHWTSEIATTAFVFLVDGLDECEPVSEHGLLVDDLQALSGYENVKLCVSSRPWKPFEPRLGNLKPHLVMQQLNSGDMNNYIHAELAKSARDAGTQFPSVGLFARAGLATQDSSNMASSFAYGVGKLTQPRDSGQDPTSNLSVTRSLQSSHKNYSGAGNPVNGLALEIGTRSEGVFLWAHLVLKDLRDEMFAGKQIAELQEFVENVPFGLMDFYKYRIWKRIGWRRERQVAMAFKIATVLCTASEPVFNTPARRLRLVRHMVSFLPLWHLQQDNRLEDSSFATNAPIKSVSNQDFRLMFDKTKAFLGEVCKDLITIDNGSFDPANQPLVFLHRSVLDFLTDPETQSWIDARVPGHFHAPEFLANLTLLRLKMIPETFDSHTSMQDLCASLDSLVGSTMQPNSPRRMLTVCVPDIRASMTGVGAELASQFEQIALIHLRANDANGFSIDAGTLPPDSEPRNDMEDLSRRCATWFRSFGLCEAVTEIAARFPSYTISRLDQDIFGIGFVLLFNEPDNRSAVQFVKQLLNLGLICDTPSWHQFLYLWWNSSESGVGGRVWPTARMLLATGVQLESELCLSHRSGSELCTNSGNGCMRMTPTAVLHKLIKHEEKSELSVLLRNYANTLWLRKLDKGRRKRRCALYRAGRTAVLRSIENAVSFRISTFELQYAAWVHNHERLMAVNLLSEASSKRFYPIQAIVCHNCGVHTGDWYHWICLSCLEFDYCMFCVPIVRDAHVGNFQCIGYLPDPPIDKSKIDSILHSSGDVFDAARLGHESTKDMTRDAAIAHVRSILEEEMGPKERKWEYIRDSSIKCRIGEE